MVTTKGIITEYFGLSTDTKPTDARNGSKFTEIDTGVILMYDEENGEWNEVSSDGGSGGGSATGGALLVTLTYDNEADDGSYTSSHTAQEIFEAIMSGTVVEMMESNRAGFIVVDGDKLSAMCFAIGSVGASTYALAVDKYSMNPETNIWTVERYNANFDS